MPIPLEIHQDFSGETIQKIDHLCAEIGEAMSAISRNSLDETETSVSRQEILCIELQHLLGSLNRGQISEEGRAGLRSAMKPLGSLNSRYADLIDQSRSSNSLLYSLCCCYSEGAGPNTSPRMGGIFSLEV